MNKSKILITSIMMLAPTMYTNTAMSASCLSGTFRDKDTGLNTDIPFGYIWTVDLAKLLTLDDGKCLKDADVIGKDCNTVGSLSDFTPCPQGYYCVYGLPTDDVLSADLCKCPAGSTTSGEGASKSADCNVCDSGYEYNGRKCVPDSCPAGQTLNSAGACTDCAVGTYKSTTTTEACTSCGTGKTTANTGSTSSSDCICTAGYGGSSCTICAKGSYKSSTGSASCTSCGTGKTTADTGSTDASDCICAAGYGGSSCTICVKGSYKSTTGSAACTSCGTGKTTASTGSTSSSACVCAAGYGGSSCTICPIGTYKSATGPAECTPCPNNGTTDTPGATSEDQCIATAPQLCEFGATMLHVGDYVFNLYPNEECASPAIRIGLDDGVCCAKLQKGEGVNALHVRYNGEVYHTVN